ncbi:MAG: HypC/HybG/HupF family hydrogenase formation chaperone [Anaerolineaceae bacterium]
MCLAVPGKIIEIYLADEMRMARVDFGGVTRQVCLEALPNAKVGDYTIIHAGFALSLLDEEEALESLETFKELSDFEASNPA